ncbi:DHA2 family efflux MFS transporter permease subunit [Solimonas sp. K1W22B-7]|nr:DHA2 family efflux MFS transporter permease subunit [Solimonas sp. K1W22B-7]
MAAFMEVLDTAIANVSLVHIAGSLSASPEEATWVLTSYLVANAIVLPMTGWLSDTIGRKRYYLGCMAAFTLASLLCGLAPSLPVLVVLRIIQGLAGAGLQPVSQAILADSFPPEKRGMAMAVYGMAVISGPALGPTVGGWITDQFSWHWIFLINVPVGLALMSAAAALIRDPPEQREATRKRRAGGVHVDYMGFALIAVSMGSLQLILDLGQKHDWFDSDFILSCTLVCFASLAMLIYRELTHDQPIINLRLLGNRNFAVANLLAAGMSIPLLGLSVLLPQMMQTLLGYSALDAGVVVSPGALVTIVMMPFVGKLAGRMDPRVLASGGYTFIAGAMLLLTFISLDVSHGDLVILRILQMFGMAFVFIPLNALAYTGIPPGQTSSATAIINLMRNLGGSIGVSLVTFSLARATQVHHTQLVDRVNPLDPAYQATMQQMSGAMGGDPAAHAAIAGMIQRQAGMLGYIDVFYLLASITAVMALSVWIARRPENPGAVPMDAH